MISIKINTFFTVLFLTFFLEGCGSQPDFTGISGDGAGFTLPGMTAQVFAPGTVSTPAHEYSFALSPDLDELFFTRHLDDYSHIYHARAEDGLFQTPQVATFSGEYADYDQAFSPDGKRLYFASDRPRSGTPFIGDIYFVEREGNGWSEARSAGESVNTSGNEACPSVTKDGHLYYHAAYSGGKGSCDIYRAEWKDGRYQKPLSIDTPVNSGGDESNAFIAPDESYILFGTERSDSFGGGDLYVSFRTDAGAWTEPSNLGPGINTSAFEYCPSISPNEKWLFFARIVEDGSRHGDIFWVDAEVVFRLRP